MAELEAQALAFHAAPQNLPNSMASIIGQATLSLGVPSSTSYLRSRISSSLIFQPSCPPMAIARDREDGASDQAAAYSSDKHDPPNTNSKYTASALLDLASIPSSAIERIVANYADTHLPQYPCISRFMLDNIVQRAKCHELGGTDLPLPPERSSELDHFEHFVLYIVLAISTMTLTWKADGQARRSSESFYNSALIHLQQLEECSQIKSLRVSLLLAHYAQMCPERLDNWTCIANAVRIVLDMGLYRKYAESIPADQARERSELFWVTYGMERSLCTNLRLPLSFPEEIITADVRPHIPIYDAMLLNPLTILG